MGKVLELRLGSRWGLCCTKASYNIFFPFVYEYDGMIQGDTRS